MEQIFKVFSREWKMKKLGEMEGEVNQSSELFHPSPIYNQFSYSYLYTTVVGAIPI
jgi:hypothetical protein